MKIYINLINTIYRIHTIGKQTHTYNKMSDILKVFVGAGQEDTTNEELNYKKLYVNALGSSFENLTFLRILLV